MILNEAPDGILGAALFPRFCGEAKSDCSEASHRMRILFTWMGLPKTIPLYTTSNAP
jgi:hypothetical protein